MVGSQSSPSNTARPGDNSSDPDNTRRVSVTSPTSSDNSTNPSPFTVLSQSLSPAIYTPLSLSVDSSHFFYGDSPSGDADAHADAKNLHPDSQSNHPKTEPAPRNERPEHLRDDGGGPQSIITAQEKDNSGPGKSHLDGVAATLQPPAPAAAAALSFSLEPASTSTSSKSSPLVAATGNRRVMNTDGDVGKQEKSHAVDVAKHDNNDAAKNGEGFIDPPKQTQSHAQPDVHNPSADGTDASRASPKGQVNLSAQPTESPSGVAAQQKQSPPPQQQQQHNNPHAAHDPNPSHQESHEEDDGAKITDFISRTTGQPGSTPLPFLQFSRGRGRKVEGNSAAQRTDPAAGSAADSAGGADRTLPDTPSSPTSLIEHLQESLHQSASASPGASSDLPRRPHPIVRTTSDSAQLTVCHPVPDLNTRSGAYVGNIAALEKTAERLSMTSSIEDAIRDLHCELKRSDSRRSSILAAAVNASAHAKANAAPPAADEPSSPSNNPNASTANPALVRHLSSASNIVEVNSAARHGGYSPAGYVMSPSHSLTGRLRSGSRNSTGRPDFDVENFMSRKGPGKSSTRSVRSAKPSLAEIAESEPTALTQEVLDEADRAPWLGEQQDDANANAAGHEDSRRNEDTTRDNIRAEAKAKADATDNVPPSADAFHDMLDEGSLHRLSEDLRRGPEHAQGQGVSYADDSYRPSSRRSISTFDANNAFSDFDGVHCAPDLDMPGMVSMPEPAAPEPAAPEPRTSSSSQHSMPRPQSYYDEETGQHMLYYPARVPAMLNLPPKLSKKPKAAVRNTNARHSKVLSAMGHPGLRQSQYMPHHADAGRTRESVWLPDPIQSAEGFSSLFSSEQPEGEQSAAPQAAVSSSDKTREAQQEQHHQEPVLPTDGQHDEPMSHSHKPSDRRSKLHPNSPPAALRSSVALDLLPSPPMDAGPDVGSATNVLDSILDASANAPVDAFIDHTFAGKLGKEVYGREKRAKARNSTLPPTASSSDQKEQSQPAAAKKRMSLFPFGKSGRDSSHDERKDSMAGRSVKSGAGEEGGDNAERKSPSASVHDGEPADETKGQNEGQEEGAGSEEEEEEYQGPPTTLLAELQIRKQEQKMRTRKWQLAATGGLQSTLLEMDAVAEAQRKNRKAKRVNLAWEEPDHQAEEAESDDDDVPLGILYAAKAAGNKDISAVAAELHRPLGLLERRELEENEPLSSRRARLQGNEPLTIANRRSMMTLNPGAAMSTHRLSRMPSPGLSPRLRSEGAAEQTPQSEEPPDEPEVEGETLGERMRRLKEKDEAEHNDLPRARPVSSAFSAELLSQFGDLDDEKAKDGDKPKAAGEEGGGEEEETLGQRRKRLQAEREAREREISMNALTGNTNRSSKRLSLANVLSAHPVQDAGRHQRTAEEAGRRSQMPPTTTTTTLLGQDVERKRAEEQARIREQEARMAALRSQMPQALHQPSVGTHAGGFRGGMYNDGSGGRAVSGVGAAGMDAGMGGGMGGYGGNGFHASRVSLAPGYGVQAPQFGGYGGGVSMNPMAQQPMMHGGAALNGGYAGGNMGMPQMGMNMGMGMGVNMPMPMNPNPNSGMGMMSPQGGMGGMPMNMGMNVPMHTMQMPMMPGQPGQVDSIERWRQSVMP